MSENPDKPPSNDDAPNASESEKPQRSPIEWSEVSPDAGELAVRKVVFKVELPRLTSHLQNAIQFELDVTRLTLAGIKDLKEIPTDSAENFFHFNPATNRKLGKEALKEQASWWTTRNTFRNCVEALAPLLEHTRDILAIWSLTGLIKGEDYNKRMQDEREKFHWLGWDKKLKFLTDTYRFDVPSDWREIILGITKARNCLVHRAGLVGPQDCTDGSLTVRWLRLGTFRRGPEGTHPVGQGDTIVGGQELVVARHPAQKTFKIGDVVHFTIGEVNEIAYTLFRFGDLLKPLLDRHRRNLHIT